MVRPSEIGKSSKRVQGNIGYFGLETWWLTVFSPEERNHIQTNVGAAGLPQDLLTSGEIISTSGTVVGLLSGLASWFGKPADRAIAHKILNKAVELSKDASVLDVHFLYGRMIEIYYKDRENSEYLDKAVTACRYQIALAPDAAKAFKAEHRQGPLPSHKGYQQLAIILEKQMRFHDAIALSRQAESQGWAGDWDHRIGRCQKKLQKV